MKKAERQRIDAFELWCWRRLLRVPSTARRSNQSILKEISPGCSLEGLLLKLKLQYFGHLMRRVDSLEKTLMLGWIEGFPIGTEKAEEVVKALLHEIILRFGLPSSVAARQASLSITNSRSSLRLRSIESVMPSSHLILCCPLFLLPPIPPSITVFSNESTLRMR